MRVNFGNKPFTYPQPVFILAAYDENGKACAMNAAWGGISDDHQIMLCLSAFHKTVKNIEYSKEFTISMATKDYVKQCDYLGIASGNQVSDKLAKCGLTTKRAEFINAPLINELPLSVECRLQSYDSQSCMLLAEIVNVSCESEYLTDGKVDPAKLKPITFDPFNNCYREIGEKVDDAFSAGKCYFD